MKQKHNNKHREKEKRLQTVSPSSGAAAGNPPAPHPQTTIYLPHESLLNPKYKDISTVIGVARKWHFVEEGTHSHLFAPFVLHLSRSLSCSVFLLWLISMKDVDWISGS